MLNTFPECKFNTKSVETTVHAPSFRDYFEPIQEKIPLCNLQSKSLKNARKIKIGTHIKMCQTIILHRPFA